MRNPPLAPYVTAVWGRVMGWSEVSLHALFLIAALAAVLGVYALGARLTARPWLAALAALASPALLVSSTTVMCDVAMLAFWVWGPRLVDRRHRPKSAARPRPGRRVGDARGAHEIQRGRAPAADVDLRRAAEARSDAMDRAGARPRARACWCARLDRRALRIPVALAGRDARDRRGRTGDDGRDGGPRARGARVSRRQLCDVRGVRDPDVASCGRYSRRAGCGDRLAVAFGVAGIWRRRRMARRAIPVARTRSRRARLERDPGSPAARDANAVLLALWTIGTLAFAAVVSWSVSARYLLPVVPGRGRSCSPGNSMRAVSPGGAPGCRRRWRSACR